MLVFTKAGSVLFCDSFLSLSNSFNVLFVIYGQSVPKILRKYYFYLFFFYRLYIFYFIYAEKYYFLFYSDELADKAEETYSNMRAFSEDTFALMRLIENKTENDFCSESLFLSTHLMLDSYRIAFKSRFSVLENDVFYSVFFIDLKEDFFDELFVLFYEVEISRMLHAAYFWLFDFIIKNLNHLFSVDFDLKLRYDGYLYKSYLYVPHYLRLLEHLKRLYKIKRIFNIFNMVMSYWYWLNIFVVLFEYHITLNNLSTDDFCDLLYFFLNIYTFDGHLFSFSRNIADFLNIDYHFLWSKFLLLLERIIFLLDINLYYRRYS